MTLIRTHAIGLAICTLCIGSVSAQPDVTGTGGGPLSTEKAPNTTLVGQTKPPSRDASPTSVKPIDRVTPRQVADDTISTKVCVGCGSGPSTTGSLTVAAPTGTLEKPNVRLDELRTATAPTQQSDLDTVTLASAHREQAKSVEEKTNGLWQSWVVSVCKGCGDQKPAKALEAKDYPFREVPMTSVSVKSLQASEMRKDTSQRGSSHQPSGTLAADLSPNTTHIIRQMPK
ncbi:hypothetical protein FV223_04960 [Methylobacterium sp. WL116]|nr:hypothetical protein FV223_04960 [Methylobacterium sp. WL116]